jgi:hypothetical protein
MPVSAACARKAEIRYRMTKTLPYCTKCGNSTALVRSNPPLYIVECGTCPYRVQAVTRIGAIRLWIQRPEKRGGWNALLKFECCGEQAEIRCNGPDPRRYLSNQQVIIQCRVCRRAETATHLSAVSSFSILSAKGASS